MAWTDERLDLQFARIDRNFERGYGRFDRVDDRFDRLDDKIEGVRSELIATQRQFVQISWTMLAVIVAQGS